jgi:hypothetical protein
MSESAIAAERRSNVFARNPNASVALGWGSGAGTVLVWLLGLSGVDMPAEVAAVMGGAVASVMLFLGREGLKGAFERVWLGRRRA